MIKNLIVTIAMIAASQVVAAQGSLVTCSTDGESFGRPTHVKVTIALNEKLSVSATPTIITAQGQGFMQFNGTTRVVGLDELQTILLFKEPLSSDITTVMQIALDTAVTEDGLRLTGKGVANVLNNGGHPLNTKYELRDCQGELK